MGIKTYRPYTETRRFQTGLTFDEITTAEPHKPLLEPKTRISGRNNLGQFHRLEKLFAQHFTGVN